MLPTLNCVAIVLGLTISGVVYAQETQTQPRQSETSPARASSSQQAGRKQFAFRGTIEKVNFAGATLDAKNDNIPGWMAPMSMTYHVDDPAALKVLKAGDRITATVYEGDTSTLYSVRRVLPTSIPPASALPPISYVCSSPGEESYLDDKPGRCPRSGVALQPVRLDIAYKCLRTSYITDKPGICPSDNSILVPVTASVFWVCPDGPSVHLLTPGICPDGKRRTKAFEVRPHGDHNPRHGGPAVFMSDDLYHHVEATLIESTREKRPTFRAYFYDEYTRPISAAGVSAQVTLTDKNGAEIGHPMPLGPSAIRDGNAMQITLPSAVVPSDTSPAFFRLRVKFRRTDKDWVTDYQFASYSKEPRPARSLEPPPASQRSTAAAPENAEPAGPDSSTAAVNETRANGPQIAEEPLPDAKPGLLAELRKNSESVTHQLEIGNLSGLWYPALRAKDVVLKLQQDHRDEISAGTRSDLANAVQQVTLSAWQIDAAGDLGNKTKIAPLYEVFHQSVQTVLRLYGAIQ